MNQPKYPEKIVVATRGSALALAQTHWFIKCCQPWCPGSELVIKVIKTTGDKLQTASMANPVDGSTKGLFTKELEQALLSGEADFAVHSLKDLPTDLPEGLTLGAVLPRADVRDVLIYRLETAAAGRCFAPGLTVAGLPPGAVVATSSTRRQAQLLALRPDLQVIPIRGNVGTRLRKLMEQPEMDATLLAAAGLNRLHFTIRPDGELIPPPEGDARQPATPLPGRFQASLLPIGEMIPCVGQGAVGIEIPQGTAWTLDLCRQLNHAATQECVVAERSFLHAMGGGCQSPVAAYAWIDAGQVLMKAVSFRDGPAKRAESQKPNGQAQALGEELAAALK